jgi:hypothetical protein
MTEKVKTVYPAPMPLGPGDSARPEPRELKAAPQPLGAGDGGKPDRVLMDAALPPAPGDGDGDEYEGVALAPLGPGALSVPQPTIRRKRRQE